MGLNDIRDEVALFLEQVVDKPLSISQVVKMLDEEIGLLKESLDDRERLNHQVYDVLFLLFEFAVMYNRDLEAEWIKGRERKRVKYLTGHD